MSCLDVINEIKLAAEEVTRQSGYVYDPSSGLYYDSNTGYYYDGERGLYYNSQTGIYYSFDPNSNCYVVHSQVQMPTTSYQSYPQESAKQEGVTTFESAPRIDKLGAGIRNEEDLGSLSPTSLEDGELMDLPTCFGESRLNAGRKRFRRKGKRRDDGIWPPSLRMIITETSLKDIRIGKLFYITCAGATIGREKDNDIVIPDINVSKHHASVKFSDSHHQYCLVDLGSRNGTYLDDKRLSDSKVESEPTPLRHNSQLRFGSTTLLCHVHPGNETCDECEPGLWALKNENNPNAAPSNVQEDRKKELKKLKRKYGLEAASFEGLELDENYKDRAQVRRITKGSDNPHAKTEQASVDQAISQKNKGFKLLSKMGWKEGESLGKSKDGIIEPIDVTSNANSERTGLGLPTDLPVAPMPILLPSKKSTIWTKAKERFDIID